jgi:hypothetical protein
MEETGEIFNKWKHVIMLHRVSERKKKIWTYWLNVRN